MKHYEGMFILHNRDGGGGGGEEDGENAPAGPEDVVRRLIERAGGQVVHTLLWANRKLSYPIEGNQTGTYVLVYFSGEGRVNDELNREVRLSERCLRHLVLTIPALPAEADLPGPLSEPGTRGNRRIEGDEAETASTAKLVEGEGKPKLWDLLDYKNPFVLRRMISAQGKLFSRVRSSLEAKNQRKLRRAVHRARNLALLPFTGR